jgi:lysozyme
MGASKQLSPFGVKFITLREGVVYIPYQDSGGIWTGGVGHTLTVEEQEKYKNGIPAEVVDDWLQDDTETALHAITYQLPTINLQHQLDALVSLVFNIGVGAFTESTILKRLVATGVDLTPWSWFDKDAKGNVLPGLEARRRSEMRLFIYGLYD